MILRIWHVFFSGHRWRVVSAPFIPPTSATEWLTLDDARKQARYGFTEIIESCDCGVRRFFTVIGNHSGVKGDQELESLEKMMR